MKKISSLAYAGLIITYLQLFVPSNVYALETKDLGYSKIEFSCQPLLLNNNSVSEIWDNKEIASALEDASSAKVCIGQKGFSDNTIIVSMLIGSDCSSTLCPVRVVNAVSGKKKVTLFTDMMCASPEFYMVSTDGKSLKACDVVYPLRDKQ